MQALKYKKNNRNPKANYIYSSEERRSFQKKSLRPQKYTICCSSWPDAESEHHISYNSVILLLLSGQLLFSLTLNQK